MTSVSRIFPYARYLLGACALMVAAPQVAAHGPHVHGQGNLQLVLEDGVLQADLTVPGMDVVGFERVPQDDEGRDAVREALALLERPGNVFRTPAEAGCTLVENRADTGLKKDDHDHDHDHHDHAHADFTATYTFDCSNPDVLRTLEITLFDNLPGLERLIVQAVSDNGQREQRLRRNERQVTLP